jgi:hypothetical protein
MANDANISAVDRESIPTRYRVSKWVSPTTLNQKFGVDARVSGKWHHCAEDGVAVLFDSECDAKAKIAELKKSRKALSLARGDSQ